MTTAPRPLLYHFLPCFAAVACAQQNYSVETIAGSVPDRDNEPAGDAVLVNPKASALDLEGNLYFLDSSPGRVRRVSRDGSIRTVANASGDELAVGPEGNLYMGAGSGVQVIQPDGTTSYIRIGLDRGPSGNVAGLAVLNGSLYISDNRNRLLWKRLPDANLVPVPIDRLSAPGRIKIDKNGEIYLVDGFRIRSLTRGILAGNGENGIPQPGIEATKSPLGRITDLAVNSKGQVYFYDTFNRLLMRVGGEGTLEVVLDGGKGSPADPLGVISGMEFDSEDNLWLIDSFGKVIKKLDPSGGLSSVVGRVPFAGDGGPAREALFNEPVSLVVDTDGSVIVADQRSHRLRRISVDGNIDTMAGTGEFGSAGDGGAASEASLYWPSSVTRDKEGNIYFVDFFRRIRRIGRDGIINTITGGDETVDSGDGGPASEARFVGIVDLAVDSKGNIYVAEQFRIRKISRDGVIQTVAGTGELPRTPLPPEFPLPAAVAICPGKIALDSDDSLLIVNRCFDSTFLLRLQQDGTLARVFWPNHRPAVEPCLFADASAIVFDRDALIAANGRELCRVDRDYKVTLLAEGLSGARGLAVDPQGNIYVADTGNQRILKLTRK